MIAFAGTVYPKIAPLGASTASTCAGGGRYNTHMRSSPRMIHVKLVADNATYEWSFRWDSDSKDENDINLQCILHHAFKHNHMGKRINVPVEPSEVPLTVLHEVLTQIKDALVRAGVMRFDVAAPILAPNATLTTLGNSVKLFFENSKVFV
jgi:hypothetical protein